MFEGYKIRKRRKAKKMSLKELSNKSGVSVGMISQIERGLADPTLTTVYKLCTGLGITITSLFEEDTESEKVIRKSQRKTIMLPNSKVMYQLLTPNIHRELDMLLVELKPGQEDRRLISHQGEECGFVIKGMLTVVLGDEEHVLNEGDSIFFSSITPHRFINHGKEKSISVWAMTPPTF